ncbi:MAG: SDR family oxidoreductase [Chloroflexota bacterium]|nr:SDR family oxidoreductase [Dehalococcoidia bacterium]MEE3141386.1 SDR family oxidoreductase [Chloroflexota bacterium]
MSERPRLEGKVAIVTGAGSSGPGVGNGKATSLLFAREGARVLLVDATLERAEETQRMIQEEGGKASVFQGDMTSRDDCQAMADAAMERYGRLDILDNNVGMSMRGTVVDVSEDDWDRIIAVNVKSMIFASGAAIPYMKESGGGSIINISSIAGLRAHSQTPYTTTKTAVIGLTFSMAADHGQDNIRVNCIAPGLLHTPMTAPRMSDVQREQRKSAAPLGTEGTAWDVGWAAVFLASEEARWITGIVLPVEAGLTVTSPVTYTTIGQQARF